VVDSEQLEQLLEAAVELLASDPRPPVAKKVVGVVRASGGCGPATTGSSGRSTSRVLPVLVLARTSAS